MNLDRAQLLADLSGQLIVSCQPVSEGPFDTVAMVVAFAIAAAESGAAALRIEGAERVAAVRRAVRVPIIGIVKRDLPAFPVRITPLMSDIEDLALAGAAVVAVDATPRPRPVTLAAALDRIRALGCLSMADTASLEEAKAASALGADLCGSTLSGYMTGPEPTEPDLALVQAMVAAGLRTVAEGNIRTPAQAAAALAAGAFAVTVGSAITRPEHVTRWFLEAMRSER
jgi:putative N-acetylmannosamine-6-phosphate epimerase